MRTWIDNKGVRTVQTASGHLITLDTNGTLDVSGIKLSKRELDWLLAKRRASEAEEERLERLYGH